MIWRDWVEGGPRSPGGVWEPECLGETHWNGRQELPSPPPFFGPWLLTWSLAMRARARSWALYSSCRRSGFSRNRGTFLAGSSFPKLGDWVLGTSFTSSTKIKGLNMDLERKEGWFRQTELGFGCQRCPSFQQIHPVLLDAEGLGDPVRHTVSIWVGGGEACRHSPIHSKGLMQRSSWSRYPLS